MLVCACRVRLWRERPSLMPMLPKYACPGVDLSARAHSLDTAACSMVKEEAGEV